VRPPRRRLLVFHGVRAAHAEWRVGQPAARVQPIIRVTKKQAAQILREIAEADEGDDWAD
jgi:hypothetical protein